MNPKISIVVPIHKMQNGEFFLWRLIQSVMTQTYKNYELIIIQEGLMAKNTNAGMKKATGDLIKILYMDDYLAHPNALKLIVSAMEDTGHEWLATGCLHQLTEKDYYEDPHSPHLPEYTQDIATGNNKIGSPSVVTLRRESMLFFDEKMSWLLDCDLYARYKKQYGSPLLLNDLNVVIGLHAGQTSNTMSEKEKKQEFNYLQTKI